MKEYFKYRPTRLPHEIKFGGQESNPKIRKTIFLE